MKRKSSDAPLPHYPPRVMLFNLSATLRRFYDALAEIESRKRGYTVTRQELMRDMGVPQKKKRPSKG